MLTCHFHLLLCIKHHLILLKLKLSQRLKKKQRRWINRRKQIKKKKQQKEVLLLNYYPKWSKMVPKKRNQELHFYLRMMLDAMLLDSLI